MRWRVFLPFVLSYLVMGMAAFLIPGAPQVFRLILLSLGLCLFFGGGWLASRDEPSGDQGGAPPYVKDHEHQWSDSSPQCQDVYCEAVRPSGPKGERVFPCGDPGCGESTCVKQAGRDD